MATMTPIEIAATELVAFRRKREAYARDCEHGRFARKCDSCDAIETGLELDLCEARLTEAMRRADAAEAREQAAKVAERYGDITRGCETIQPGEASQTIADAIRALAPAETHTIAHAECGRPAIPGDPESGPADCDCACRGSAKQSDCARAGCGFCRVVEKPARPAPNPPRHPADAAFDGAPNYVPPGVCPDCDGNGGFSAHGKPSGARVRDCATCDGEGWLAQEADRGD